MSDSLLVEEVDSTDIGNEVEIGDSSYQFQVGEKFSSFEAFKAKLERHKNVVFSEFWIRDSRTIAGARKRGVERPIKPELRYYEVKYCCITGGQAFKAKGKGKRCTSTFRKNCKAHISLKADDDGNALEIRSLCTEHNHELAKELFRHLPQQRRLPVEVKEKATTLLRMKANKKLVQEEISKESGKVVLLKDICNIATAAKKGKPRNDLDLNVQTLKDRYGADVELYSDSERNLLGIFWQDREMKESFSAFPELLCIDATYKLLELGLPVYVMVCVDSNGQTEVVAACILVTEDVQSITWMMNTFKQHNESWKKIRVIMADKDISERDIIKGSIPDAAVLICLFHTLRSLRREISCEKMGITAGQRTACLEMVQKLAYASSVAKYNELYEQFQHDSPREVVAYFNKNWHPIKDEWVLGMKSDCGSFMNFTNNRLESLNGKLKQVIDRHSSLEDFFDKFFVILNALRRERDHKVATMFQKVKVSCFKDDSPECHYSKFLSSYAAQFVHKQLHLAGKVSTITANTDYYVVDTAEGQKKVTPSACECIFNKSMLLPCRHIFALRNKLDQPLFDVALCDKRWSAAYYRSTHRLFSEPSAADVSTVNVTSEKHRQALSQHQKFREASLITTDLASLASMASNIHYERRIELLKELVEFWKNGQIVGLTEITPSDVSDDEMDCDVVDSDDDAIGAGADIVQTGGTVSLPSVTVTRADVQEQLVTKGIANNVLTEKNQMSQDNISSTGSGQPIMSKEEHSSKLGLRVPPAIKKRGRPKGSHLTVVGLPAKKHKQRKICGFLQLHTSEKIKVMLRWFVDDDILKCALNGELIEEEHVECQPEVVPNAVLDENVDVCLIRKYFTNDAWLLVTDVIERKKECPVWMCPVCLHDLHSEASLICELCLTWYHLKCVGLTKTPKSKNWFCRSCHSKF